MNHLKLNPWKSTKEIYRSLKTDGIALISEWLPIVTDDLKKG